MRDTLLHRGPDHGGLWSSPDRQVCLGHRRLAIIDLDPAANQPFLSPDGRLALTFNGEIYNYRELRRELETRGVRFRTESDSEVLLESYRAFGDACVERFSGMFAFAIWDEAERRLFFARDRAGEKPFYWTQVGGAFLFGSELKALLEWPGVERRLDHQALVDFLQTPHWAIFNVTTNRFSFSQLLALAIDDRNGPFADHLRYQLRWLTGRPEYAEAMRLVLHNGRCPDELVRLRLHGAGLVRRDRHAVLPSCQLYANYFEERL